MLFLREGEMRPVFLILEVDRPQGDLKSGVPPPLFLPCICYFIPTTHLPLFTLSLACPSLLVPHPPLTPTYHTSHLYLAHSCEMECLKTIELELYCHTNVLCYITNSCGSFIFLCTNVFPGREQ